MSVFFPSVFSPFFFHPHAHPALLAGAAASTSISAPHRSLAQVRSHIGKPPHSLARCHAHSHPTLNPLLKRSGASSTHGSPETFLNTIPQSREHGDEAARNEARLYSYFVIPFLFQLLRLEIVVRRLLRSTVRPLFFLHKSSTHRRVSFDCGASLEST